MLGPQRHQGSVDLKICKFNCIRFLHTEVQTEAGAVNSSTVI